MAGDETPHATPNQAGKPPLFERVQSDRERGDLWLARQRLRSCLLTRGYDLAVLGMLGDVAEAMHDAYDAGRMWLLSDAQGDHVDCAVQTFMKYAGRTPTQVLSQTPPVLRKQPFDKLHPVAQERLRQLGLVEAWVANRQPGKTPPTPTSLFMKVVQGALWLALLWGVAAFLVGSIQIARWVFG